MKINIDFNWPPGGDYARVSFGAETVNDKNSLFRVGVIDKSDPKIIRWFKDDWMESSKLVQLPKFDLNRMHIVRVEQKLIGNEETKQFEINIGKEWPPEAQGASMTSIGWTF